MKRFLALGAILALAACSKPVPPGQMVDVGGFKMHIYCSGPKDAGPTVIFEAGLGVSYALDHWIQADVEKSARICLYDRAGMDWSDDSGQPHDAEHMALQLHALLQKANIAPPYVLAGHSLGGLVIRVYTEHYPDEVVGLAFLDPSHPKQLEKLPDLGEAGSTEKAMRTFKMLEYAAWTGAFHIYNPLVSAEAKSKWFLDLPTDLQDDLKYFTSEPGNFRASRAEFGELVDSLHEAGENTSLGDRPVVVISAGTMQDIPGVSSEVKAQAMARLGELHEDIAGMSTKGRRVVVPEATHMSLIMDEGFAQTASNYILETVQAAR